MSFKFFDWCSWLVGLLFGLLLCGLVFVCVWPHGVHLVGCGVWSSIFSLDLVSYYLVVLSGVLWLSLWFWVGEIGVMGVLMISLSVFSSVLCYCCVHALWFWVFYEMSIVPLLVLLVVDSPYSERYIASWYLLGYVVLTSLPMLLCLFYLAQAMGGFNMSSWGEVGQSGEVGFFCLLVLALMFVTKIPLPPFHVWLPIVHAEASSPVSVCLSGYIMKLGVLGVLRFCFSVAPNWVFSPVYVIVCLLLSVLFFFSASRELDGKRWLAFLSLSHILVAPVCLSVGDWSLGGVAFLYCLGHGLSAGVTFLFLWLSYNTCSTRNLVLLKAGMSSSLFVRLLGCSCLCTACSLPPTTQFFCEVSLVVGAGQFGLFLLLVLYLFVFMGGLVPLFVMGCLLSRHCDVRYGGGASLASGFSLGLLLVWSFLFFLVC
uniref:NADH-ubiquinone oxidoreductase chain 4 n=1 Tax=Metagonimus yokogawai TaxID=84529 RepID=V9NE15_9TREM|nr:NADH dehydrogenase subunit 4 [Metagonimus yokogawai]AGN12759.1 NADH dehydrogenase subunit 4 [Metagonimus yokogawai]